MENRKGIFQLTSKISTKNLKKEGSSGKGGFWGVFGFRIKLKTTNLAHSEAAK